MTDLRSILAGPPEEAAPQLLGCLLVSQVGDELVSLSINEVEAYRGGDDPASHAYRGRTKRNGSMFEKPGTLYTYLSYGVHTAANSAAGPEGVGWGVLIRGGQVEEGEAVARRRRGRADGIADGPGKLTRRWGSGSITTAWTSSTPLLSSASHPGSHPMSSSRPHVLASRKLGIDLGDSSLPKSLRCLRVDLCRIAPNAGNRM